MTRGGIAQLVEQRPLKSLVQGSSPCAPTTFVKLKSVKTQLALYRTDLFVCLLLLFFAPLFFRNIGSYSLEDFDEAWYGEIGRNITISGNPLLLTFNGSPYTDHPPLGFNLIAVSILLFQATEFAVRFPSALAGFLSLFLIYLTGKNLFNRKVGFISSLVLGSCVWFIFRARSGNLDTILVFFYILTFYLAVKTKRNPNFIFPLSASFALLILTKSLIGLSLLIPILAFILVNRVKIPLLKILQSMVIFLVIAVPWYLLNTNQFGSQFIIHHINLAFRVGHTQSINFKEVLKSQTLLYLHYGIRKWYYPTLASFLFALLLLFKNKRSFSANRNLIPLILWISILLFGFLSSAKTEIWQLLPLYPPIALLIAFTITYVAAVLVKSVQSYLKIKSKKTLGSIVVIISLIPILALTAKQVWNFKNEIKLNDQTKSGLSQTASAARGQIEPLYLDSDLPIPAVAAFYSQKHVQVIINNEPGKNTLKTHIASSPRPYLLLTEKWKLNADGIKPEDYVTLYENQGYVLIKVFKPLSSQI